MQQLEHPDALSDYRRLKQIHRGSMQAIEDKAIEEYMRACEEKGKEEAEKIFFNHFNKKPCESKRTNAVS